MKKGITTSMRAAIYLCGLAVVAVCGVLLPEGAREEAIANPHAGPVYPYLIGAWVTTIPIFIALYQTLKLLGFIDEDKAFTSDSIKALKNIRNCALLFAALIVLGAAAVLITAKIIDPTEDVTPVGVIGFIFVFISVVIATFVTVLMRLLQQATDIKSENELTV